MKFVISIFFPALFALCICWDDEILSKFHQNDFKIKDVRIQLMSYDRNLLHFLKVQPFKYNRTTTAHNFTGSSKVDLKNKIEVLVQAYKFLSNEYRHFPIRFQVNLKKAADSNVIGLKTLEKCGNVSSIYFLKDIVYHVCNFVVDENQFPPLIPNGKYQVNITGLYFNKPIALVALFAEIYTPIPYPKK